MNHTSKPKSQYLKTRAFTLVELLVVNACMLDGSCRFFNDDIDLDTWHALGTMAGGEIVEED